MSFFIEDLPVLLDEHLLQFFLLLLEDVVLHLRILNIDVYFSDKLLEVLHLLLVIVVVVVQLVVSLPKLLSIVLGQLEVFLHFFDHLGLVDLALLCLLLHQLFVADGVVAVLGFNVLAFFQQFFLFVLALLGQNVHLPLALVLQLIEFVLVKVDIECLLFVELIGLFVQLADLYQFLLLQGEGLV